MFVLANMWFQTLMRQFFFNIDKIVFNFISIIYDFLISIARTSILSQADILDMTGRIYKLLAVFMIFKVTFSLIMYVVNPDDFSDKNKGVSKLGLNIIISLALLILTPYIFSYAYQLQTIILEDNALSALIFGDENDPANESAFNTAGDSMAYITMSPFFTPNTALDKLYECSELTTKDGEETRINEACFGLTSGDYETLDDNESLYALTKDDDKENTDFKEQTLVNYAAGIENGNLGLMFRQDMAIAKTPDGIDYIIDYKYIFSTVTGVVVILLLLTFCLDVALRSIKLAFLQLIAPIPIISFVDPKSGKDGMFKKWYEMCFKTYISLFIRLLAIYFVAYIVSRLDKMVDIVDGSYVTSAIVKIFVIIGALMFAKQLPKILEGLGIKLDGDGKFTLNPLKKFENEALGGKKILGAAKGVTAGAMIGTTGMLTGAGIGRGIAATFGGLKSGLQGKKFDEIRRDQAANNAKMRRAIAAGSSFTERMGARVNSYFGTPGRLGSIEHDRMMIQNEIDKKKQEKSQNENKILGYRRKQATKKATKAAIDSIMDRAGAQIERGKGGQATTNYLNAKHRYESMSKQGVTSTRQATSEELNAARDKLTNLQKGKDITRQATSEEIRAKQAEIEKIKAGTGIIGANGEKLINQSALAKAEKELNDLQTNGVREHVEYSQDEIDRAKQELETLEKNGVIEHRKATDEELTEAYKEYQDKQKAAKIQYVTDVLDENNTDVTDAVIDNGYKNYTASLENPSEALRTGKELDDQSGALSSEIDDIQRTYISSVEKENKLLDDQISTLNTEVSRLQAEKEDAKASQEAVGGIEGGPSRPRQVSKSNPNIRNYRYSYREGGEGSGVPDFEDGDYDSNN